jgi:phosphoadenosine phosphosulfate reductase
MNELFNLERINAALRGQDAEIIVSFAVDRFSGGLVMSSSFGAESAMLIHLVHETDPDIPIIFVDTGFHFEETHQFIRQLQNRMTLNLHVYRPRLSAEEFFASAGESNPGWRSDVNRCCAVNKNEPFDRAMNELKPTAWLRGIRRDQADTRQHHQTVEWSNRFSCYAISPLLDYSSTEIHAYLKHYDLPDHPLFAQGYTSIGCAPRCCTRPVQLNENPRAGRWSGQTKTECGLHL